MKKGIVAWAASLALNPKKMKMKLKGREGGVEHQSAAENAESTPKHCVRCEDSVIHDKYIVYNGDVKRGFFRRGELIMHKAGDIICLDCYLYHKWRAK